MIKNTTVIIGLLLVILGIIEIVNLAAFQATDSSYVHATLFLIIGCAALVASRANESLARLFLIVFGMFAGIIAILGFTDTLQLLNILTGKRMYHYVYAACSLLSLFIGFKEK